MRQLLITLPASRDLNRISDYFLESSVDAGDRFLEKFTQTCNKLARFPYIGKSYAGLKPGLRGLLVMNYIIFYRVMRNNIEILRVINGYQDLQVIFSKQ